VRQWTRVTLRCNAARQNTGLRAARMGVCAVERPGRWRRGGCCTETKGVGLENLKVVSTRPLSLSTCSSAVSCSGTGTPSSTPPPQAASRSNTGPIVGDVVGGVAGTAITALAEWLLFRRHRNRKRLEDNKVWDPSTVPDYHKDIHGELPTDNVRLELPEETIRPVEMGVSNRY
jgi:hypothetical protein